jgi:hypothetical protein
VLVSSLWGAGILFHWRKCAGRQRRRGRLGGRSSGMRQTAAIAWYQVACNQIAAYGRESSARYEDAYSLSFRGRVHDVLPRLYAGRRISELAASWAATRPVQGDLNPADAMRTIVDTRAQIKAIQVRRYGLLLLLAHERSEFMDGLF